MIMSRDELIAEFGSIFEHSPWIAEAAFEAADAVRLEEREVERIHAAMCEAFRAAPREARLAVLRAHPDLAGRLAVAGELTEASEGEQRGAGLDQLTPDEHARFTALNDGYRERFGHPFIVAVKGLDRHEILRRFESRSRNDAETEFETACAEVERIARLRLEARVDAPPGTH